jgi:hypothetical protein
LAVVAVGLRRRVGSARLVDRVPRVPAPLTGGISGPGCESEPIREVTAVSRWIGRLTLEPMQSLRRGGTAETLRQREVLFDLIATDWDRQLAQAFRKALESRSKQSVRELAQEPKAWASCVVNQLQSPGTSCSDLGVGLVAQGVRAWIDSLTLKELISFLDLDLTRFGSLVTRVAAANWPPTRVEPDMSLGVVAMDEASWEALVPALQAEGVCAVVRFDGNGGTDGITVLRFVQGLAQGWRGFPALPGQEAQPPRRDVAGIRESDSSPGTTHAPSST